MDLKRFFLLFFKVALGGIKMGEIYLGMFVLKAFFGAMFSKENKSGILKGTTNRRVNGKEEH